MNPEYIQRSFGVGTDAVLRMLAECRDAPLAEIKRVAADYINNLRERRLLRPVEYNGNSFDTDDRSRSNIMGVALQLQAGVALPGGFTWRSADNIDVPFSSDDVIALGLAIGAAVQAVYAWSWQIKAQIASADFDELLNIVRGV